MKNCKQIATEWGLSERTVNDLCKKNKIDGAIKVGKMWKIPDDAKKPIDGRITSGKYVRHSAGVTRKPLPIGISDYVRAQADYYYVDKDRYPGILMELKWKKNLSADELSELADEALAQIGKKRYDVEMKENGTQDILKFGIVFSGKKVSVKIE